MWYSMKSCCGLSGLLSYRIYYCCNRSYPVCHSILCQILLDFLFLSSWANLVSLICWADIYWETMTYCSLGENNWLYPHRDSVNSCFFLFLHSLPPPTNLSFTLAASLVPFFSFLSAPSFYPFSSRCISCFISLHFPHLSCFSSAFLFHCQLCQCIWRSSSIDGFMIRNVKFRGQINSCQGDLIPRERRIIIQWGTWNWKSS